MKKEFNIIITGVGGQGIITLLKILAESALLQGFDVKTSELHGLSQREGSVSTHIRFGKEIHSPIIGKGKADLIFGLEINEALRISDFANKNTVFLINKKFISYIGSLPEKEILENINKKLAKAYFIEASEICKQEFNKEVLAGIYLLGYAIFNNLLPLKKENVLKAIKQIIPTEYFEINKKAFELGKTLKNLFCRD